MPRGGPRGGGINLRSLAIQQLKARLTIDVVTANGTTPEPNLSFSRSRGASLLGSRGTAKRETYAPEDCGH